MMRVGLTPAQPLNNMHAMIKEMEVGRDCMRPFCCADFHSMRSRERNVTGSN
jgi:hypothetical protein